MSANTLPFEFGNRSSSTVHAADLGNVYYAGSNAYRLVQNVTAALTTTARGCFVDETSATTLTFKTQALAGATSAKCLGFVSPTQVSLAIGDFFLVQVAGIAVVTPVSTTTAGTGATTAASGAVAVVTATFAAAVPATIIGTCLNTVAGATGALIRMENLL